MSDTSPRLGLPFIKPAQAQKHVTHNEAMRQLDALVQLNVIDFEATVPPSLPCEGDAYALGPGASGEWAGQDGAIAIRVDSAWQFFPPDPGWIASLSDASELRIWSGTAWLPFVPDLQNLAGIGINTSSNTTNRLSVSSPATLLSHEGSGHQVKVNKASTGDTASLLFQSNWSGRAEMGLAGDDSFSIKISGDGSAWDEALKLSPGVQVYHSGNIVGTVSAAPGIGDAIIETGSNTNGDYTKFADGTMICRVTGFATASGAAANWAFPGVFADTTISINATLRGPSAGVVTVDAVSNTSADIYSFDMSGADTVAPDVDVIAVGRWM